MAKQPAVTPHGDPNVMVSPMSGFIRMHLYAEVGALAVFTIAELLFAGLELGAWFEFVLGAVCTVLWIVFDFSSTLNAAMRDRNLVKYKYIQYDKWKGLKSGLFAQIPGVVVIILIWLTNSRPGGLNEWVRLFYFILYGPITPFTGALTPISQAFFLLPVWICPAVAALAYYCGYNEIPFFANIVYKNRARSNKLR